MIDPPDPEHNSLGRSVLRVLIASALAIPACASLIGLLLLLPGWCALGTMFIGLVLFSVGHHLELNLPLLLGGVMMFAGVFAAAVLGAIR